MNNKTPTPVIICLELDCVTGEKIVFQRSNQSDALVTVSVNGQRVEVKPAALLLVIQALNLEIE